MSPKCCGRRRRRTLQARVSHVTLKLCGSPHSQFTYKVALALRLSGTPFHFCYVNFSIGEHRKPWFRELSRWGQVPVLTHG